jgi:ribosomal-protein-alanine N-acetyltransferase
MAIRRFSVSDIHSVMRVTKKSLGEVYPPSLYLTLHNIWPDGFMVLEVNGQIVGFVAAVESEKKVARVLMLAVLPEHRRRSYGSMLLAKLQDRCMADSFNEIKLEVRKSNVQAISFYERRGFSVSGEIRNFYLNGEDAYQMSKVLQS